MNNSLNYTKPPQDTGAAYFDELLAQVPEHTRQAVDVQMQIAARIKELLTLKGWSQKDLAEKMAVSPARVSQWLTGLHNFTVATLARISFVLGEDLIQVTTGNQINRTQDQFETNETFRVFPIKNKPDAFTSVTL